MRNRLIVSVCLIMLLLTACSGEGKTVRCFKIETSYGPIRYPEVYKENLQFDEVVNGEVTVFDFSMIAEGREASLFQLIFGNINTGNMIGYIDKTPVTMIMSDIYEQAEMDFENEELIELYRNMQGALDYVLASIYTAENYHEDITVVADRSELSMAYWKIKLPETIRFEEEWKEDTYCATFYGEIGGKTIKLYSVCLGMVEDASSLGSFQVDGVPKTISVVHYDMEMDPSWSAEEKTMAEYMYSSVSEVLEVIFNSEKYTDKIT